MSTTQIVLYCFFGLLLLASLVYSWILASKNSKENKQIRQERDALKMQFDQLRKEKLDFEEKLDQAKSQELTFKVAYEDWKSKYSLLEEKYFSLRKLSDQPEKHEHLERVQELEFQIESKNKLIDELNDQLRSGSGKSQQPALSPASSGDSKIVADLKSVLDQHLAIISQIIGDEKMEQYTAKTSPADPLHLIKGIDENISQSLQKNGIRSFEQLANSSRRDLRKWMIDFEDVDVKIIDSWPYQAEAILNLKSSESK